MPQRLPRSADARVQAVGTLLVLLLCAAAVACKGDKKSSEVADGDELRGELLVFAAASLTDAFTEMGAAFEAEHDRVTVEMNFAGSQSLRTQIENGAQPQVFASANATHIDALAEAGLVRDPVAFARNELVIVTPAANPAGIESLRDLPRAERLVLAGENVPAGLYAGQMLENAAEEYGEGFADQVLSKVVSRETHVRQTLQKVVLGEADAAIVYATDAASAGDKVAVIDIGAAHNILASYPIARVSRAPRGQLAGAFIDFVLSDAGQSILGRHGFRPASR